MIRDRLEALPLESLRRIADQYDIDIVEGTPRETLVDLIFEAMEEFRLEKQASDTNPVKVEESKYVLFEGAELEGLHDSPDDLDLPEDYNETRIVMMVRDPAWAFAYWEIGTSTLDELEEDDEEALDLVLRVTGGESSNGFGGGEQFDIPVKASDRTWYINLPRPEARYWIDLIARGEEGETLLARSNTVLVPPGGLIDERKNGVSPSDHIIAYSGLEKLDVAHYGDTISQRILGLMDESF